MPATAPPTAIVLCGGKSRRFGGEKALALVGGRRVIDRVVGVVAPLSGRVIAVTAAATAGLGLPAGVEVVADEFPGTGPLGGICTGLRHTASDVALVVGGDLPFLVPGLLQLLLDLAEGWDAVAPRRADGYVQPLHTVYARACLPRMEEQLARGERAGWRVLQGSMRRGRTDGPLWSRRLPGQALMAR
jgi:molybdopterin-guanine dinucleotide biosynthesis protein A